MKLIGLVTILFIQGLVLFCSLPNDPGLFSHCRWFFERHVAVVDVSGGKQDALEMSCMCVRIVPCTHTHTHKCECAGASLVLLSQISDLHDASLDQRWRRMRNMCDFCFASEAAHSDQNFNSHCQNLHAEFLPAPT